MIIKENMIIKSCWLGWFLGFNYVKDGMIFFLSLLFIFILIL